jgi:hypothetical protein
MAAKFTVMLCVHRPPAMLPFAMQTVLAQNYPDFELFVVCDGASPETIECAEAFAARDARVRVFNFPKGERHGEAHRHVALAAASGEFIAHIADDDLWLPDHLTELAALLDRVEFGNLLHTRVSPDGSFGFHPGDLADPDTQARLLNDSWTFFGPSVAGYRLSTYRRLPVGWSPAPSDLWTDVHMWRKFLRLEGVSVGTRAAIETLSFSSLERPGMGLQERRTENERWSRIVGDSQACSALRTQLRDELNRDHAAAAQKLLVRNLQLQRRTQRITDLKRQLSDCFARIKPLTDRVRENHAALARHAAAANEARTRHAAVAEELRGRNKEIERLRRRIAELKRMSLSHRWRALWKRKAAAAGKNDPAAD